MQSELMDLARRAVQSAHFRWMPGMRVLLGHDIVGRVLDDGSVAYDGTPGYRIAQGELPDLEDAATLGCLLAMARHAVEHHVELTLEPGCLLTEVETLVDVLETGT